MVLQIAERRRETLDWRLGHTDDPAGTPETWAPATVPGAVQLDWAEAEGRPPYWKGENFRDYAWMEDVCWVYESEVRPPEVAEDERLFLVLEGVDYEFDVLLNGRKLHSQEGMFRPAELDLTGQVHEGNVLRVVVHPVPKRADAERPRAEADHSVKPAVSYGWDWHPRLVPLGIWEEAYWEVRPDPFLEDLEMRYSLSDALDRADLRIDWTLSRQADCRLRWRLLDPDGEEALSGEEALKGASGRIEAQVAKPQLWWPNGQGDQPLYRLEGRLLDADGRERDVAGRRAGFRRVRLVMNEGAWQPRGGLPHTRAYAPMTLEVNGRRIFAKGSNWVNPEIFPGTITRETYRPLLELARDAHFNLLRCWGGAIVDKESFFDLCDEMGIMVWQEFPLACNAYPDEPSYLEVLDAESRAIIRRVRRHACRAIWCGGNELFNAWSGMSDQSLPLRLLNRNCYDMDPQTPYLPTSPLYGAGHGDYRFRRADGRELYSIFSQADRSAYVEFGCPGPSPAEYLRTFIPEDELWPPGRGGSWEAHHAFEAWADADSWLYPAVLEHYFGPAEDLEEMVQRGAWLQSEGYKCLFEEARRQKMRSSMALNWCYNEPWPTAANNSLVNWPAEPKPAYYAVQSALRPVLASAQIPRFSWQPGEQFEAELWLLNDRPEPLPAGKMKVVLEVGDSGETVLTWEFSGAGSAANLRGPVVRCRLPEGSGTDFFTLRLEVEGRPDWTSEYRLHLQG
mgnify:FL=1